MYYVIMLLCVMWMSCDTTLPTACSSSCSDLTLWRKTTWTWRRLVSPHLHLPLPLPLFPYFYHLLHLSLTISTWSVWQGRVRECECVCVLCSPCSEGGETEVQGTHGQIREDGEYKSHAQRPIHGLATGRSMDWLQAVDNPPSFCCC